MREQPNKRALEFVVKVQNFIQKVFPSMQCVHLLDFITTWNWLVGKGQLSVGIVHWPYIWLFYTLLDLTSLAGKPLKIRIIIKEKNTGESLKQVRRTYYPISFYGPCVKWAAWWGNLLLESEENQIQTHWTFCHQDFYPIFILARERGIKIVLKILRYQVKHNVYLCGWVEDTRVVGYQVANKLKLFVFNSPKNSGAHWKWEKGILSRMLHRENIRGEIYWIERDWKWEK